MTRIDSPATLNPKQRVRYARLRMLADSESRVLTDSPGDQALIAADQGEPELLPRYASTGYAGSDCWIALHSSRRQAAQYLADEAQDEASMAPGDILDLDTGRGWSVRFKPVVAEWPADTTPASRN